MQITQQTWSSLLLKFLKGTISKPEREELDRQRAQSPMKEAQFQRISSPRWITNRLKAHHQFDKEASWNQVLARLQTRPETLALPPKPRTKKMYWAAAIAACLVGIAGLAYWLWPAAKNTLPATEHYAALPNKARLIWQDSSYVLEEVKDGLVVQSGAFSVRKEKGVLTVKGPVLYTDSPTGMNELVLPEGSHYKLRLPDSTLVTMNASSRIRFPTHFSTTERKVEIEGEGFLKVAKNPAIPFIVQLRNEYAVQVKGTSFYVSAYPNEEGTRVKLVEGRVSISSLTGQRRSVDLLPDQLFMGFKERDTVMRVSATGADKDAWEDNEFNLNKDLRAILQDIAHWHGMSLQYPAALFNPELHGRLDRAQSLSKVIERLQVNINLKIRLTADTIYVAP